MSDTPEKLSAPICLRLPESVAAVFRVEAAANRRPVAQYLRVWICDRLEIPESAGEVTSFKRGLKS